MTSELHTKLDQLAANIKDAEKDYENSYHAWVMAGNGLRRLEREHRKIWLELFERTPRETKPVGWMGDISGTPFGPSDR